MMIQVSFVDGRTTETWTVTHEFSEMWMVVDYLMERPPGSVVKSDLYLAHVMVGEGNDLYFHGWQGDWILINSSEYHRMYIDAMKRAQENKQRLDELRAEGKIKPVVPDDPEKEKAFEDMRQRLQDAPGTKERYEQVS